MFQKLISILDPNTRRRLRRFGKIKRATWSLYILLAIFLVSIFSNFIANEKPMIVKADGKLYFPVAKFYPEDAFLKNGINTRPRYKQLDKNDLFTQNKKNWMLWPMIKNGPEESLAPTQIEVDPTLTLTFSREARIATVDVDSSSNIQRSRDAAGFFGVESETALRRKPLETEAVPIPESVKVALAARFENKQADVLSVKNANGVAFELDAYKPRSRASKLVRLTMKQIAGEGADQKGILTPEMEFLKEPAIWSKLSDEGRTAILERAKQAMAVPKEDLGVNSPIGRLSVHFDRETIEFPFRPVKGHSFGLDNSGRDVGVRILYATRTALIFSIALVIITYLIGIFVGAVQGYFGQKIDMFGQRLTEIWESMPFLLIMILMSSIYGRSFWLLGLLYGGFSWIGISYYMRAEFLRLRKQPFVESAKVMGIGRWKIMFRHILPNALVPVITFFPFSLVGAIFILTSLDFLGFGLPAGTPSWGDLLSQGQTQSYAWWLVLYPTLALFIVSLLGIFIGEGVRAAFDPRTNSRLT